MTITQKTVHLIGSASGIAASSAGTADGPLVLKASPYLQALKDQGLNLEWRAMLKPASAQGPAAVLDAVLRHNQDLAAIVADLTKSKEFFTVFGGDHSCAIGTWSGASSAIKEEGDLGLIWIDAHLDSHTFATSQTGNIHGMPLASLLGLGDRSLASIQTPDVKLKPEHVCVIGARSYEQGEVENLKNLNVRIYFMEEVEARGLDAVMQEALTLVKTNTAAFGVTIDIDSIDPREAPGTGVSEPGGLSAASLCRALMTIADDAKLIGTEIVEFDPHLDKEHLTEKLVPRLMAALIAGKLLKN